MLEKLGYVVSAIVTAYVTGVCLGLIDNHVFILRTMLLGGG
jgi:hypothetical protein